MATSCAVVGCTNSRKKLRVWNLEPCAEHENQCHEDCACLIPYKFHTFPSNPAVCREWVAALQRKGFKPGKYSAVCSIHFIDGCPTKQNPTPKLKLGYKNMVKPGRRVIVKHQPKKLVTARNVLLPTSSQETMETDEPDSTHELEAFNVQSRDGGDGDNGETISTCQKCQITKHDAETQWEDISLLDHTYPILYSSSKLDKKDVAVQVSMPVYTAVYTNSICKFYTGLALTNFLSVVDILKPVLGPSVGKMCWEDQILMVLMRLRLGLLFSDLALRFGISTSLASQIFSKLIRIMSEYLGKCVHWLPRDVIRGSMPNSFKFEYPHTTCIIDCSEIFLQRPKLLRSRAQTYSHYKSHNTSKFLIAVAPNGFIMFLSRMYGGRASDKFIVSDSGFLNFILPGDQIMADRGFTISDELFARRAILNIPAFLRGKKQLSEEEIVTTRRIASVRIHVERMINRVKTYRILKYVFPISQKRLLDDILVTIGALCNCQNELIKQ